MSYGAPSARTFPSLSALTTLTHPAGDSAGSFLSSVGQAYEGGERASDGTSPFHAGLR